MNPLIQFKKATSLFFITVALLNFVLLPQMRAVTPPPDGAYGSNTAEGFDALGSQTANTFNTAIGWASLTLQTTASFNTAVGAGTLVFNTESQNSAFGAGALLNNTTGNFNNAVGAFALFNNTTGTFNNAHGHMALAANTTGIENDAFGDVALSAVTTGSENTAMGDDALDTVTTGSSNTGVGKEACSTCTTGSDNVAIGHNALIGTSTASHNIAIGVPATGPFANLSFTAYIGSIHGLPTSNAASTLPVLIDSNNVLGTSPSSRRYKHDIKPLDKASEALYALKPISFVYNYDESRTTLYGLIAEDVVKVNTSLVAYIDGKPFTVKYDQVNVMLLNEFLKEHRKVERLTQDFEAKFAEQQKQIEALTAGLQKVNDQLELSRSAPQIVGNSQ